MKYLIIPGLNDSNEIHWQSKWEKNLDCIRLQQNNWSEPQLDQWLSILNKTINECDDNLILVAHSLGCVLVSHWVQHFSNTKIKAALLVAPADVDSEKHTPEVVRNFAMIPTKSFPFRSILIASTNDPYMTIVRAKHFASVWGSEFINVGDLGHINADSDLGDWEFGQKILKSLNP